MQVTLKLFASLTPYLPEDAHKNQVIITVGDDATVQSVIDAYKLPEKSCHLVMLNGIFQPPAKRASSKLTEGDALAVWPPVAGG